MVSSFSVLTFECKHVEMISGGWLLTNCRGVFANMTFSNFIFVIL